MALRILAELTELETDPFGFNTTALVSQPERRRLRTGGDYRVVHTLDDGELVIWPSMTKGPDSPESGPFRSARPTTR